MMPEVTNPRCRVNTRVENPNTAKPTPMVSVVNTTGGNTRSNVRVKRKRAMLVSNARR